MLQSYEPQSIRKIVPLSKHHNIKAYKEVQVKTYASTWALDMWVVSFMVHCTGEWVRPTAALKVVVKRRIPAPDWSRNPVVQPLDTHFTDSYYICNSW